MKRKNELISAMQAELLRDDREQYGEDFGMLCTTIDILCDEIGSKSVHCIVAHRIARRDTHSSTGCDICLVHSAKKSGMIPDDYACESREAVRLTLHASWRKKL